MNYKKEIKEALEKQLVDPDLVVNLMEKYHQKICKNKKIQKLLKNYGYSSTGYFKNL